MYVSVYEKVSKLTRHLAGMCAYLNLYWKSSPQILRNCIFRIECWRYSLWGMKLGTFSKFYCVSSPNYSHIDYHVQFCVTTFKNIDLVKPNFGLCILIDIVHKSTHCQPIHQEFRRQGHKLWIFYLLLRFWRWLLNLLFAQYKIINLEFSTIFKFLVLII